MNDRKKIWFDRNREAEALENEGKEQEALALYEENAEEGCDVSFTYERIAAIYGRRGVHDKELEALKKAVEIQKDRGPSKRLVRLQKRVEDTERLLENGGGVRVSREEREPVQRSLHVSGRTSKDGCFNVVALIVLTGASLCWML